MADLDRLKVLLQDDEDEAAVLNLLARSPYLALQSFPDQSKPLHLAAQSGNPRIVSRLLSYGSDPNCLTQHRSTPLHCVVGSDSNGAAQTMEILLDNGARVNERTIEGVTPLFFAARWARVDLVKFFLSRNADTELANKDGRTPLHISAHMGHFKVVELLVESGANISAKDRFGKTPLDLALEAGHSALKQLLTKAGVRWRKFCTGMRSLSESERDNLSKNGLAKNRYVKVVLVGDARTGKTSTARNMLGEVFDNQRASTNAIRVSTVVLTEDRKFVETNVREHYSIGVLSAWEAATQPNAQQFTTPTKPAATPITTPNTNYTNYTNNTNNTSNTSNNASGGLTPITPVHSRRRSSVAASSSGIFAHMYSESDASIDALLTSPPSEITAPATPLRQTNLLEVDVPIDEIQHDESSLVAMLYDFGGQDVYQTANELFFTPHCVVLLFFDMERLLNNSPTNLHAWLQNVTLHAKGSPVLLVGTRADLVGNTADQARMSILLEGLFDSFPQLVRPSRTGGLCFIPIDNHRSTRLLRSELLEVARRQQFEQAGVPVRWLQCLDILLANPEPLLSLQDLLDKVTRPCGVEASEVQPMLRRLHDMGFIGWYKQGLLSRTIITNPQAVIDAIGLIITVPQNILAGGPKGDKDREQLARGVLTKRLAKEIWSRANIPEAYHDKYLLLMEKFDLLCELNSREEGFENVIQSCYLVPSMLPTETPVMELFSPIHYAEILFQNGKGFPNGVFHRLSCKARRWSQLTSTTDGIATRNAAQFAIGSQGVVLRCVESRILVSISGSCVGHIVDLIEILLEDIRHEAFPELEFKVVVKVKHNGKTCEVGLAEVRKAYADGLPTIEPQHISVKNCQAWVPPSGDGYDVFISYRTGSDSMRARALSDCLELCTRETQEPLRVFLDAKSLLPGQEWDRMFVNALFKSLVAVPFITTHTLKTMEAKLAQEDVDHVLLEWMLIVKFLKSGRLKTVVPVVISSDDVFSYMLPDVPHPATNKSCEEFLRDFDLSEPSWTLTATPRQVFKEIVRHQAIVIEQSHGHRDWDSYMKAGVEIKKVVDKQSTISTVPD